jgi:hypothetical protein
MDLARATALPLWRTYFIRCMRNFMLRAGRYSSILVWQKPPARWWPQPATARATIIIGRWTSTYIVNAGKFAEARFFLQPMDGSIASPRLRLVLLLCLFLLSGHVWGTSLPAQIQPQAIEVVNRMVQAETAAMKNRQRFEYTREVRSTRTKGHLWRELVVETPEGRMHRLLSEDGKRLSAEQARAEDDRIANLVNHPDDFRREGQRLRDDEGRLARLLRVLPRAFLFRIDGSQGECTRVTFQPNQLFEEQSYEDRVIHAMSGVLFIHTMRLCGIDAHLDHEVQFGFGLLGEVSDGSSFLITREEVFPGQWKTVKLRIHVNGSMLLLKSFSRDEESSHFDFKPVANNLSVAQAAAIACSRFEPCGSLGRRSGKANS